MNPYASHLGTRNPLEVIASTPGRLAAVMAALGREGSELALAPGKWSVREILCHLADTELAFSFRLRQALAEPHHTIQPFDQDRWAANYAAYDASSALRLFTALRDWNRMLFGTVPPAGFSKPVTHPERGELTFKDLIETMAGHDLNHLTQLETICARRETTS